MRAGLEEESSSSHTYPLRQDEFSCTLISDTPVVGEIKSVQKMMKRMKSLKRTAGKLINAVTTTQRSECQASSFVTSGLHGGL
jgi:hypothetical protein